MPGEQRRDLRKYRQGAGKIPKTHRAAPDPKPSGCGRRAGMTVLLLLALPGVGVWALIERLVS